MLKRISTHVSFCMGICLLLGGCEEGSGTGNAARDGDNEGASVEDTQNNDETPDIDLVACGAVGPMKCYCPGGLENGTQECRENGTLSKCECPEEEEGSSTPEEVTNSNALCAELQSAIGCEAQKHGSVELPSSIMFVVDRSASMICNPPPVQETAACDTKAEQLDPDKPTKWDLTIKALKTAFESLQGQKAVAGLSFFSNDDTCGVNSKPAVALSQLDDDHLAKFEKVLDKTEPRGGTPIVGATILAYQHLHEEASGDRNCPGKKCPCKKPPCGAPGNRFVVLITDGMESCASGEELDEWLTRLLDEEAPKAVDANVRTFVVGAPGSDSARGFLSELAFQGGTAVKANCKHDRKSDKGDCHFDMTQTKDFGGDLKKVLEDITTSAVGCEFTVPETMTPEDENDVNIQYTLKGEKPICIAKDDTKPCDDGADGWQFGKKPNGDVDLSKIVLCGKACDTVQADQDTIVEVLVGCATLVVY